jgi:hypothetical protein
MVRFIYTAAFIVAWAIPAFWELVIILDNPFQIFNPFLQIRVLWMTITEPMFWGFNIVGGIFLYIKSKEGRKVDHNI